MKTPNRHTRFEESDLSDCGDSLEDIPPDDMLLIHHMKQRYRRKEGRNNFNPLGVPKFLAISEQARTVRGGRQRNSNSTSSRSEANISTSNPSITRATQAIPNSGMSMLLRDEQRSSRDLQAQADACVQVKRLEAKKVLSIQKKVGIVFSLSDDQVEGKLVSLEQEAVNKKAQRDRNDGSQ